LLLLSTALTGSAFKSIDLIFSIAARTLECDEERSDWMSVLFLVEQAWADR
jgi:hypothetical protein